MKGITVRRSVVTLLGVAFVVGVLTPTLGEAAVKAMIGTAQLKDGAVTNAKVRKGTLRYSAFRQGEVASATLAGIRAGGVLAGTFPNPGLGSGSVTAAAIATGAVGAQELAAGSVRSIDIANGAVGPTKIAPNSIGKGQLATGGVGAAEIATGAVGPSELAVLPGGKVSLLADTSLASGAVTIVPLSSVEYANGSSWSAARPDRLTAPIAGVYQVTGSVFFQTANGSGARSVFIVSATDTSSIFAGDQRDPVSLPNEPTEVSVSAVLVLTGGESLALAVRQTSGSPITLGSGQRTSLALQFLSR